MVVAPILNAVTDSQEQTAESFLHLADLREALICGTLCCTLRLRIGLQRRPCEHEATIDVCSPGDAKLQYCLTVARRGHLRLALRLQQPP